VNEVTQSAFDPISREPNYKQCAVRVEKTPQSVSSATGGKFLRRKHVSVQERCR
jgi:hypothetical protein